MTPRPALVAATATALAAALAAGCTDSTHYVVVTVDSPQQFSSATTLSVTLTNNGTSLTNVLALKVDKFPVMFSVSAPGRTGDLTLAVDATDENGLVVGHGTGDAQLSAATAEVMLDTTDFVVNTDFAGNQFPSNDFEAAGFQLASLPDGTWTAVFRDDCASDACNLYGRRFDRTGTPKTSAAAASANMFNLNTVPTADTSTPAVAASQSGALTTLAVWDYANADDSMHGIACRPFDTTGQATVDDTTTAISADDADVVSLTALANGNFVATWDTFNLSDPDGGEDEVHAAIIKPDCTPLMPQFVVSTTTDFAHRSAVTSNGDTILISWVVDGDLHIRLYSSAGVSMLADTKLVAKTATDEVEHARLAPVPGGGFVLAARFDLPTAADGTGHIDLYQLSAQGAIVGTPAVITSDKSGSDPDSNQSFGLTASSDGMVLAAWHSCGTRGDDSQCGVFGRYLQAGKTVSDEFVIPTTTLADQVLPSVAPLSAVAATPTMPAQPLAFVAIWADSSGAAPDSSGQAARARILYPPLSPHFTGTLPNTSAQPAASSSLR